MDQNTRAFCKELKELMERYHVTLGVEIDGDTFGVQIRGFAVIDAKKKHHYLSDYSAYLTPGDLRRFAK